MPWRLWLKSWAFVFIPMLLLMKSSQITKKQLEFVWEIKYIRQISSSVVQTIIIPKVCYKHLFADTARPIGRKKYLLLPLFCFIWGSIKNWIIWRITISFLMWILTNTHRVFTIHLNGQKSPCFMSTSHRLLIKLWRLKAKRPVLF